MRHTSRRRSAPDPLAPLNTPAWLVVRNGLGYVLQSTELAPRADLREILTGERAARIAAGWLAAEIGPSCSFFFASRGGDRVLVGIEQRPPRDPLMCRDRG